MYSDCIDELPGRLACELDTAFEALVRAYQHRLYGLALRLTNSPPEAEEIAQDAFVRAYRALAGYAPERIQALRLRPWLFQITLNVWRNRARRAPLVTVTLDDTAPGAAIDVADTRAAQPDAIALQHEQRAILTQALAALPPRYRAPVALRHIEGLTYLEIGALLHQPAGTVKSNVHRGIRQLRTLLDASALDASEGEVS